LKINCSIIGGGIVGLMTAREVARAKPSWDIAVFESSEYLGDATTGRNSGVLHSGIYYPTNSLKHTLCMQGNSLWREEPGANIISCGKMLVGDDLSDLEFKANNNGVEYRYANDEELEQLNLYTHSDKALFIASTGVLDIASFIREITYELKSMGVAVLINSKVTELKPSCLKVGDDWYQSDLIINCAGLGAIELRSKLGLTNYTQKLVKGRWLTTTEKFEAPWLIYPKPLPNLLGLGVHSCIDPDGSVRFGPDAYPIVAGSVDYTFGDYENLLSDTLAQFPNLDKSRISPSMVGIRTKLEETTDFVVDSPLPGYIEALGIESPGLTAVPAIAKLIVDLI